MQTNCFNRRVLDSSKRLALKVRNKPAPDLTTIQPLIDAVISGNHVNVKWGWGGNRAFLDICELQVDRNDGKGFVLLAYDTTPRLHRHATFSGNSGHLGLPRHLPRGRQPNRPMEPARERHRAGINGSRSRRKEALISENEI
jgi:hypothetical protein